MIGVTGSGGCVVVVVGGGAVVVGSVVGGVAAFSPVVAPQEANNKDTPTPVATYRRERRLASARELRRIAPACHDAIDIDDHPAGPGSRPLGRGIVNGGGPVDHGLDLGRPGASTRADFNAPPGERRLRRKIMTAESLSTMAGERGSRAGVIRVVIGNSGSGTAGRVTERQSSNRWFVPMG